MHSMRMRCLNMEEKLIVAVEKNPLIYDKSLSSYKSANARNVAWESVRKEIVTYGKYTCLLIKTY